MELRAAETLAKRLIREYLDSEWSFKWDNAKTMGGRCWFGPKEISLSRPLTRVRTIENIEDAILHEIAHAKAGPRAHHNQLWKIYAHALGARPEPCFSDAEVEGTWTGTCPNCGASHQRHRLTQAAHKYACKPCCIRYNHGRFSSRYLFVWTRNTPARGPVAAARRKS